MTLRGGKLLYLYPTLKSSCLFRCSFLIQPLKCSSLLCAAHAGRFAAFSLFETSVYLSAFQKSSGDVAQFCSQRGRWNLARVKCLFVFSYFSRFLLIRQVSHFCFRCAGYLCGSVWNNTPNRPTNQDWFCANQASRPTSRPPSRHPPQLPPKIKKTPLKHNHRGVPVSWILTTKRSMRVVATCR